MKTHTGQGWRLRAGTLILLAVAAGTIGLLSACIPIIAPTGSLAVTLEPLGAHGISEAIPEGIPMEIRAPSTLAAIEKRMGTGVADSKAWVAADKVVFELYNGSTLEASGTKTYASTQTINLSSTLGVVTFTGIDTGSYDWLKVSIYNTNYGTDPVSIGWDSGIVITNGGTASASVNCIPVVVTVLSDSIWSSTATLAFHGERWYQIPNTTMGTTTFSINRVSGTLGLYPDLYIFDSGGVFAGNETTSSLGIKSKVILTPDSTYYVALFGYAAGSAQVAYMNGGAL